MFGDLSTFVQQQPPLQPPPMWLGTATSLPFLGAMSCPSPSTTFATIQSIRGGSEKSIDDLNIESSSSEDELIQESSGTNNNNDHQNADEAELLFQDIFESHPTIDYSDNREQARVIQHHYLNEFGKHISLQEVMKDYSDNVIIHEVVDNTPKTYRGREGVKRAFRDMYRKIPHDTSHFEFEHIAIDHDHAQVVWKAEIPEQDVLIRGMDSFAFDKDNRITNQSTMAVSTEINREENQEKL